MTDFEDFKNEVYRRVAKARDCTAYFGTEHDRVVIQSALESVRDYFMAKAGEDNAEWWPPSAVADQVCRWIP